MWNGTMFVDLDWPLNASSLLSASAELLVLHGQIYTELISYERDLLIGLAGTQNWFKGVNLGDVIDSAWDFAFMYLMNILKFTFVL